MSPAPRKSKLGHISERAAIVIPIARVAEQLLARVHALPLDEAADYLDLAARLVRILSLIHI